MSPLPPALPWHDLDTLAAAWRAMIAAREAQAQRVSGLAPQSTSDFWTARAPMWRSMADLPPDPFLLRTRTLVDRDTTVLDVGAGGGRYALRLAPDVRSVTCVEPAEGMRAILEELIAERGVANVRSLPGDWETVAVEPEDVVICSHVIYSVGDIAGFVRKLHLHARRTVVMAVRIDQFDSHVRDLWAELHGEPRAPEPTFVDLHPILHALGIAPNVEVTTFSASTNRRFETREAAERSVADLVVAGDRLDAVARYVGDRMRETPDGWEWTSPPVRSAILWWDATDPRAR